MKRKVSSSLKNLWAKPGVRRGTVIVLALIGGYWVYQAFRRRADSEDSGYGPGTGTSIIGPGITGRPGPSRIPGVQPGQKIQLSEIETGKFGIQTPGGKIRKLTPKELASLVPPGAPQTLQELLNLGVQRNWLSIQGNQIVVIPVNKKVNQNQAARYVQAFLIQAT